MTTTIYLALGSNLNNRLANLQTALAALAPAVQVIHVSPVYETDPWGYLDQPAFLNQVAEVSSDLSPQDVLKLLKEIEQQMGRESTFRNGPRVIDLDILLYGDMVVDDPELQIPHPRMRGRSFVLVPLADLIPSKIHPVHQMTYQALAAETDLQTIHPYSMPLFGNKTYVMGILNITPDSFSGDGLMRQSDLIPRALEQASQFIAAGADILDIGGESTRPGSQPVGTEEEMDRVIPVIEALAAANFGTLLSVDTYKARVAEAALKAGAHWVNDVWGLRADPDLAQVAARFRAPVVLMHNRSKPTNASVEARLGGRYVGMAYNNLLQDVQHELLESVELAASAKIPKDRIILDPGIGFGKTVEQNLELLNRLNELKTLGYPLLLGPSRKSFIGYTLNLPPEQRLEGTLAACVVGILRGADILRVHDVEAVVRTARMTDAILQRSKPPSA